MSTSHKQGKRKKERERKTYLPTRATGLGLTGDTGATGRAAVMSGHVCILHSIRFDWLRLIRVGIYMCTLGVIRSR